MAFRSWCVGLVAAVIVIGAASCDESPAAPDGGTSMVITSVTPESPVAGTAPQTVTVRGQNFLTGLSLFVKEPQGTERVFSDIQNLQLSSFQATVVLPQTGVHELRVGPSSAALSQPLLLVVRATQTAPVIFTVTPSTIVRGAGLQAVRFDGLDFDPNLVVTMTAPAGVVTVLTVPQLSNVTATSVQANLMFATPGVYTFVITNSSGELSNTVQVNVN